MGRRVLNPRAMRSQADALALGAIRCNLTPFGARLIGGRHSERKEGAGQRSGQSRGPANKTQIEGFRTELAKLHVELVKLQQWVVHKGLKICIGLEGRDGAGKGGCIKALTEREKTQMYAQRYLAHFPAAGEIAIFDRSWRNRAGVERVMVFFAQAQAERFLEVAPGFEMAMSESGIVLLKYWLEMSQGEQRRRLEARIDDGRKIWKLSPMDVKSFHHGYDDSRARDDMFAATDTSWAPWRVLPSDDKKRARLNLISHILSQFAYQDLSRGPIKLPKRQDRDGYIEPNYPYEFVSARDWAN